MRCVACNCNLSDKEANRKFLNYEEIPYPEDRYIMLCDVCLEDTDILTNENPLNDEERPEDE